jgi:hypothetical protein
MPREAIVRPEPPDEGSRVPRVPYSEPVQTRNGYAQRREGRTGSRGTRGTQDATYVFTQIVQPKCAGSRHAA